MCGAVGTGTDSESYCNSQVRIVVIRPWTTKGGSEEGRDGRDGEILGERRQRLLWLKRCGVGGRCSCKEDWGFQTLWLATRERLGVTSPSVGKMRVWFWSSSS